MYLIIMSIAFGFLSLGCKESTVIKRKQVKDPASSLDKKEAPGINKKFRVAVIDDGFDTSLPVFKDKIVTKMTLKCDESLEREPDDVETSITLANFEQLKKETIASILKPDPSKCRFEEMKPLVKGPGFQEIGKYRTEWNDIYLKKRFDPAGPGAESTPIIGDSNSPGSIGPAMDKAKYDRIHDVVTGEGKYNYHGTYVASLIAYKNDNVDLVFIQIDLAKGIDDFGQMECKSQSEMDILARLFSDPDVIRANREAPLSPMEKEADDLFVKYNIDFDNQSFGGLPTKVLEEMYLKQGCPPVSLGNYNAAINEFTKQRSLALRERGLTKTKSLSISSFGNDGVVLDTPNDGEECSKVFTINVAATDSKDKPASFTNTGRCLDVMAPGVGILVATPDDFVFSTDGTSFSSPLFVRHLTQTLKPQASYEDLYKKLKGSKQIIGASQIPSELLSDNSQPIGSFSLTGKLNLIKRPFLKRRLPSKIK